MSDEFGLGLLRLEVYLGLAQLTDTLRGQLDALGDEGIVSNQRENTWLVEKAGIGPACRIELTEGNRGTLVSVRIPMPPKISGGGGRRSSAAGQVAGTIKNSAGRDGELVHFPAPAKADRERNVNGRATTVQRAGRGRIKIWKWR